MDILHLDKKEKENMTLSSKLKKMEIQIKLSRKLKKENIIFKELMA